MSATFCRVVNGGALVTACKAVTAVSLSANNVGFGAQVTLSWSGAAGGAGNPVRGYEVYRDGALLMTVFDGTSCTVASPASNGSYRYTVKALGSIAGFDAPVSTASAGYDYGGSYTTPGGGGAGASGEKKDATFGAGQFAPGAAVTVTVGAAGTGATYSPSGGGNGGASSFGSLLSARGGGAGHPGGSTNATYPDGGRGGDGGICGAGGGYGRNGKSSGNIGGNGPNGTSWGIPASDAAYYVFNDPSTGRRLGRGGRGGSGEGGGNGAVGNDSLPGTRYGQGGDGNNGNGTAGIVAVRVGRYLS